MYDKEFISKVCNLTCTKDEVCKNHSNVKLDTDSPFRKYYNANIVEGAINKYLSNEWDDQTLASWSCVYNWIISHCIDNDDLKENLNSFEEFMAKVISWDLDGMSFFDKDSLEEDESLEDWIQLHKNWSHILETQKGWKAAYSTVGPFTEINGYQYVVVFNEELKEYMIIFSEHLENGFEDERFKFISEETFVELIEQLKDEDFKVLSCSEKWYYMDISEEEEE